MCQSVPLKLGLCYSDSLDRVSVSTFRREIAGCSSISEILKAQSKKTWWTVKYSELLRIDYPSGKINSLINKRALTSHWRNFVVGTKGWLVITKYTRLSLSLLISKSSLESFTFFILRYWVKIRAEKKTKNWIPFNLIQLYTFVEHLVYARYTSWSVEERRVRKKGSGVGTINKTCSLCLRILPVYICPLHQGFTDALPATFTSIYWPQLGHISTLVAKSLGK